jgi:hypothetical protein
VLLSVIEEQRILERNGLPAKDILKAAVAAIEEKIKAVDKADNTNHQGMHQETYMQASFSTRSTTAGRCHGEANRRLQIESVNYSVKREKTV